MKICSRCKIEKPFEEFNKNSKKVDGLQTLCRSCTKEINAHHYKTSDKYRTSIYERNVLNRISNTKFLSRFKSFKGCYCCGEKDPCCLDLHHIDSTSKENDPSSMKGYSRETLKNEVRKCIVVCANCHRKIHAGKINITSIA